MGVQPCLCRTCSETVNKNIKLSSFKSSENIQKKEGWPDSTVSNNQFSSVTLNNIAIHARKRAYYNFEFQRGSRSSVSHDATRMIKVGFTGYFLFFFFLSSTLKHRSSVRVFTFLLAATKRNSINLIRLIFVIIKAVEIAV